MGIKEKLHRCDFSKGSRLHYARLRQELSEKIELDKKTLYLSEEDLNRVAAAGEAAIRRLVTPQTACLYGLEGDLPHIAMNVETGEQSLTALLRRCGDCKYMTCVDGNNYCNYNQ